MSQRPTIQIDWGALIIIVAIICIAVVSVASQ